MKIIIKARVGTCVNTDTDDIRYQLQFKAEGEGIPANLFCSLLKKIVEVETWYNQTSKNNHK